MSNLTLASKHTSRGISYDLWEDPEGRIYMTTVQLAELVGYKDKKAIEKAIERNPYLKDPEFSTTDKVSALDGKLRDTRLFTEDGIYEIAMMARTEEGKKFRASIRAILRKLYKKRIQAKFPIEVFTECEYLEETGEAQEILLGIMKTMNTDQFLTWYDRNIQSKREHEQDKQFKKDLKAQGLL